MSGGQIRSRLIAVAVENEWNVLPIEGAHSFAIGWGVPVPIPNPLFSSPGDKPIGVSAAGAVRVRTASGESLFPFPPERSLVSFGEPIVQAEIMLFNNGDVLNAFMLTAIYGNAGLSAIDG